MYVNIDILYTCVPVYEILVSVAKYSYECGWALKLNM